MNFWNVDRERAGSAQGSLCVSLMSDRENNENSTACCKQIIDQNSFMLWSFWSLFLPHFCNNQSKMNIIKALCHSACLYCLVQSKLFHWTGFYGNSSSIFLYLYFHCSCSQTKWKNGKIKMSDEVSEMPTRSLWLSHCQGQLNSFVWVNSHNAVNNCKRRWKSGCCLGPSSQKSAHSPV